MVARIRQLLIGTLFLIGASLAAQSMMQMKEDATKAFDKADAELNATYKKALSTRSAKGAAALKEAQRSWITYRDATCEAYGNGEEGGSLEILMNVRCMEGLTKNRTAELKRLFLSDHYPY